MPKTPEVSSVFFGGDLLKKTDEAAQRLGMSRSEFVRFAILKSIDDGLGPGGQA